MPIGAKRNFMRAGYPAASGTNDELADDELLRYIALVIDRKVFRCTTDTNPRHAGHHRRHEFARSRGPRYGRGRGGPRARRGDVRAAVLALLAERPMHGYEMIKEIEERTEGAWTPSAGSIYPTLQLLEDEGLIRGEESDGKRRFTLTEAGSAEQEEKAGEETPWDAVRAGAAPEADHLRDSSASSTTRSARSSTPPTTASRSGSASCSTRAAARSTRSSPRRARPGSMANPLGAPCKPTALAAGSLKVRPPTDPHIQRTSPPLVIPRSAGLTTVAPLNHHRRDWSQRIRLRRLVQSSKLIEGCQK